eukprot:TRINITY_DN10728_c0_g3_i1.p1 TRINITY_DN10728_c0_g3~~TRINITY_DN10728_c0_g3_i1.p1  ORF type:complete len:292 (+),score=29.02 TRINITY_DN10728_c0_g3_i1:123-878(+)
MESSRNESSTQPQFTTPSKHSSHWFNTMRSNPQKPQPFTFANLLTPSRRNAATFLPSKFSSQPAVARVIDRPCAGKTVPQVVKENGVIKRKMEEYNASVVSKKSGKDGKYDGNIMASLKSQALRIDYLLARKSHIVEIVPFENITARATKFLPYNAKISCKNSPKPLRMNISVNKGFNNSCIYLSFYADRPDVHNCDQLITLARATLTVTLIDKKPKEAIFNHDWIYLSLQTQSECAISYKCLFGKGILWC